MAAVGPACATSSPFYTSGRTVFKMELLGLDPRRFHDARPLDDFRLDELGVLLGRRSRRLHADVQEFLAHFGRRHDARELAIQFVDCLLYTSDAADERS